MDSATPIGIIIGYTLVILAIIVGPGIGGFIDLPSLLIVVGGVAGLLLMNYPLDRVVNLFSLITKTFSRRHTDPNEIIKQIVNFSIRARRDGILALEAAENEIDNVFLNNGIKLAVDGNEPEVIKEIMERELEYVEDRHMEGASILHSVGEYSPAMGMIGTLIGLIAMLQSLDNPAAIGPGMALAIITTFYGMVIAYLFALPLEGKLKIRSNEELLVKRIIIAGIMSIQAGDNPRLVERKLNAFLRPKSRETQFESGY
ncbi:MAG: MotA/TolQ/ExbB proton channel family protein [Deferribacterota bacterium]|nr:MotA/TolQ/ExbB proton channel family protein [Deferribacterota bacterium]